LNAVIPTYKQKKLQYQTHFKIDGVGEPFNLLYCAPPKSGTTNWHRGIAVLKDFIKGKHNSPEDYNPREIFAKGANRKFEDMTKLTQIEVARNPFARLYSAWKDKSRTFRFENCTVDWDKAAKETTWIWGTENRTETEKYKILKKALNSHDQAFNAKALGIKPFETSKVPFERRFTWEAMTQYIAQSAVGDESKHNAHWRTQYNQCGICSIDYDIITQIEHSEKETRSILKFFNLTDITHFGHRYTHQTSEKHESSHEKLLKEKKPFLSLTEKVIEGLYRHYWLDFVLLGYSIPPSLS